jgi:hypothetical protein
VRLYLDRLGVQVHRASINNVVAAEKNPMQITYTLTYKDGDKKGKAHPNKRWTSEDLGLCDWSDDDASSDEDTPHRWREFNSGY